MGKCSSNFFFFFFPLPCDVYLGFFLFVALVYLNPGFLYEKKKKAQKTQTCLHLCISFCFVTATTMLVLWAYLGSYFAFC